MFFLELHLHAVVDGEHGRPSHPRHYVGCPPAEERFPPALRPDLPHALSRPRELHLLARGHHHPPPHRIERVGQRPRRDRGQVAQAEGHRHVLLEALGQVRPQRVVDTEVETSVDDHAQAGHCEPAVEALEAVTAVGLADAVPQPGVLARLPALGLVGEPGAGVVQWVDDHLREGPRSGSGQQVAREADAAVALLDELAEEVPEGEVERLREEEPESVGGVALEEGGESVLQVEPAEAIEHAIVAVSDRSLVQQRLLQLQAQLYHLNGRSDRFRDEGRCASEEKLRGEGQPIILMVCLLHDEFILKIDQSFYGPERALTFQQSANQILSCFHSRLEIPRAPF